MYAFAGGNRDFYLLSSCEEALEVIRQLPTSALITLFLNYDLPLRGIGNEDLINTSKKQFTGVEYIFVIYRHPRNDLNMARDQIQKFGWLSSYQLCEGIEDLESQLRRTMGEEVAIGLQPEWDDPSTVVSAIVPHADGSISHGAY